MTYTTSQNDMWDAIAYKAMGDPMLVDKLMMANPDKIDFFLFPSGITLNIPEVAPEEKTALPPWKVAEG